MPAKIPPLHALKAFEAAARHGSFVKAADELCVTRSAISHRILLLETQVGAPLFQRDPRTLTLTSKGAAYLAYVRKALEALDELSAQTGGESRGRPLILSLSVPPTFARVVLVPRLKDFNMQFPDIELAVQLSVSQVDYRAGDADVEIRFGTGVYPDLESHLLLDEPVFPVANPDYAACCRLEKPADLERAVLLRSWLEPWKPWFAAAGLTWNEPATGPRFEDLALLYQAAADGQGVALARATLAQSLLDAGVLRRIFSVTARSPYAYYLIYRRQARERPEVTRFVDWLSGLQLAS